jgi:hypothetical protein
VGVVAGPRPLLLGEASKVAPARHGQLKGSRKYSSDPP